MSPEFISLGITFVNSAAIIVVAFSAGRLVQKVASLEKELVRIITNFDKCQADCKKTNDSLIKLVALVEKDAPRNKIRT